MATNSAIEWTDATWNPLSGCTPVSPGCLHCYAATMAYRLEKMGQEKYRGLTVLHNGVRTFNGVIRLVEGELEIPLKRRTPTMYFVNSMSDLFHKDVPFEFIDKVFAVMALCPQHTFQCLTKRPERMAEYTAATYLPGGILVVLDRMWDSIGQDRVCEAMGNRWPLPNVWLGTSVENQEQADKRISHLLKCPAKVRFLSCEPLLGPIKLGVTAGGLVLDSKSTLRSAWAIHWVIVGGESGGSKKSPARPCDIDWIRSIIAQCKAANVPAFVKQIGSRPIIGYCDATGAVLRPEMEPEQVQCLARDRKGGNPDEWPEDLRVRQMPVTG